MVHVGAHEGQEVPKYRAEGRSPIICFEPQWLPWKHLECVQRCALSDNTGTMRFNIPWHLHAREHDTQSASGLRVIPERAIAIGWTPTDTDTVLIAVMRFDAWAACYGFESGSCSKLVVDVQGMELQVLKGFGDYLLGFYEIIAECSSPAVYDGGASTEEVAEFLSAYGFRRASPTVPHGDVKFERLIQ